MTALQVRALGQLADALAKDVGRLRRNVGDGYLVDRFADHAWRLAGFVEPTAAAIYQENGGDVGHALATVDERARQFRRLLGEAEPR